MKRLVIVGGGVIGTMHALQGTKRGYQVVQIERDLAPRGASVRNFGLIWVGGRAGGAELELALRARQLWEELAGSCQGTGFRPIGSLTVARTAAELAVLEEVVGRPDAATRGFSLLSPSESQGVNPSLKGTFLAALHCRLDAAVEPRLVLGALRSQMEATGSYTWLPNRQVMEIDGNTAVDHTGTRHQGDLVICCVGARSGGFLGEAMDKAPLRRVRLQMLETEPFDQEINTALADGDSLRYYPAYAGKALDDMGAPDELGRQWALQLLLVRRLNGCLTIGDTHTYSEPFPFDIDDAPDHHLLGVASSILGSPLPAVQRRWSGVYSQVTDPNLLYYRAEIAPGVFLVTGPGGRGMTLSPAIAERSFL